MPVPNQTIAKLFHYEAQIDAEFAQIYDFLQFAKYPRDSINGSSLKLGSVPPDRIRPPFSANGLKMEGSGDLVVGGPQPLGGGAVATLGTTGGAGPAGAAQVEWLQVEVAGVTKFIPLWE